MMGIITNLAQPVLINAIKANLYSLFYSFERSSPVEFFASARLVRWRTEIPHIATVPPARGQGIGAAFTVAPLRMARAVGYRAGVLQSSKMGFPVYQRLGFRKLCAIEHFYWAASQ